MKKIYVCSPYRGEIEKNIKYARNICRAIALEGNIPVAPHIYFTQFLDDEIEEERRIAMKMNLELIKNCDEILICGDNISEGMKEEISFAEENKIKIKKYGG